MSKRNKPTRTSREEMIASEIRSLRAQVAVELTRRSMSSGLNVSLGDINEEYNPDLATIRGRVGVYDRMINDPFVRGQLRNIEMTLISGVRWKVVDGTDEQQELVGGNVLRDGPPKWWCQSSWYDFLHEALGMMIYGWAMFGLTRAMVDGKIIYRQRKWLHPRSVDENGWIMDADDNLVEVRRSFTDPRGNSYSQTPISIDDLFLMCWDRRGPNWEGNALIRPMFKNWKIGEIAEKIDIIDLQNRGIAIPVAKLSGAGGPKERNTLVEILRTLRGANKDKAFLVLEKDESLEFLTSTGSAKDPSRIIDNQHIGMAKVGGGEYAEIGPQAGGRASTSVLATGFFINTDAIRIFVQDMINFGCGPLPGYCERLQNENFDPNAKGFKYTTVQGSRVSPTEQFDNIPLIQDAVSAGLIPPTLKYANETARRLGWPELTEQEFNEGMALLGRGPNAMGAGPGGMPQIQSGGRPNEAGADENASRGDDLSNTAPEAKRTPPVDVPGDPKKKKAVAAAEATEASDPDAVARRSLRRRDEPGPDERGWSRDPTDEESHALGLAQIDSELRGAEARYAARIHAWQRREVDQIVERVRSGRLKVGEALLEPGAEEGLLRYRNQLRNDLRNVLTQVQNFGGAQVREEMRRGPGPRGEKGLFNPYHDELGRFDEGDGGGGGGEKDDRGADPSLAARPDTSPTVARVQRAVKPSASTLSEAGYVYHATNAERAIEIAEAGAVKTNRPSHGTDQDTWPDGSTERRSYWIEKADRAWQFAPEEGRAVILRVRDDAVPGRESGTGDRYAKKPVPAEGVEILTDTGWEPLTAPPNKKEAK